MFKIVFFISFFVCSLYCVYNKSQPGALSEALRAALGMESAEAPPPWLINMQR